MENFAAYLTASALVVALAYLAFLIVAGLPFVLVQLAALTVVFTVLLRASRAVIGWLGL